MEAFLSAAKPNLSKALIKKRARFLETIGVSPSNYKSLKSTSKIMKDKILTSTDPSTQSTRLFHIIEFLKIVGDEPLLSAYTELMKPIKAASVKKQMDTSTTHKAERYSFTLKELQDKLSSSMPVEATKEFPTKNATIDSINTLQQYLLLYLYVMNPPVRNDYFDLKIVSKASDVSIGKGEPNYLCFNNNQIFVQLNSFKNAGSFGPVRIDFTAPTKSLIRKLFGMYKALGVKPPSLFNSINEATIEPVAEDAIRKRFEKAANHYFNGMQTSVEHDIPHSINDMRHIWVIAMMSDPRYSKLTESEKLELHNKMLHSPSTAAKYNRV